jgi:PAS domain S-box-containing protein
MGRPTEIGKRVSGEIKRREQAEKTLKERLIFEQLQFERLISRLSSDFVNIPVDKIDDTIKAWLRTLAEFFGVDRCTIGLFSGDATQLVSAFDYHIPGSKPPAVSVIRKQMPWYIERLMEGNPVIVNRLEDLPPEAERERRFCLDRGIKSILSVPLTVGGNVLGSFVFVSTHAKRVWPENLVPRLRLVGEVFANVLKRKQDQLQLEEQLRFAMLLSEISGRFVNLSADQIDGEIVDTQRRVCECLGLDLSALWQWSAETPRVLTMTHFYRSLEGPPPPSEPMHAHKYYPWCQQQLEIGRTIVVSSTEDVPAEAVHDQESWRRFGIKTTLIIPLSLEGGQSIGALSFNNLQKERTWPEALIQRMQLVAQIFTNALFRKQSETALRESEARLNLTTEAVGAGLWIMDVDTGRVWVSPKSRELFCFVPDEEITYESYFRVIHPEDRDRVHEDVQHTLQSGANLLCDYRIVLPDGDIRWIISRGQRFLKPTGKPDRLMGLSFDITPRKEIELKLKISETSLDTLINSTTDLIWSVDAERFGLVTFNSGLYDYFLHAVGLQIKKGMSPEELFPGSEEYVKIWRSFYQRLLADGPFITEYGTYKGKRVLRVNFNLLKSNDEVFGISVFAQDITKLKKMENQLREQLAEINNLKLRLEKENIYLREEVKTGLGFGKIIGSSETLQYVLFRAQQVAPTDATVLILGETGVGKGMVAHAIHGMSSRKDRPMVTVNCAALPANLVESELFGRERGAFTGAHARQAGRFEVADGGTIFLDEIGELPLELQTKLLRVLQDGEYERLGSSKTIKVNVRVIASTNRDLKTETHNGRFREDLYYRLNTFPVTIPPLRMRTYDIPELVRYFLDKHARKLGKRFETISKDTLQKLQAYSWPGNVRELEHVIERAVITSPDTVLQLAEPLDQEPVKEEAVSLIGYDAMAREHILQVLQKTRWKIDGEGGAASILGLNPSTLRFRLNKLGIKRSQNIDHSQ